MNIKNLFSKTLAGGALALASLTAAASGQWPNQPIKLVVPIDAGTNQDAIARKLATALSDTWNQTVTVVNQPGAAGAIGTQTVASSASDGNTIGLISATFTGSLATRPNLPFTRDKLTGVTKFGRQDFMIFASKNAPFNDVQQMVAYSKLNPGKLDYATPGTGSYVHITMEHLARVQNLNLVHVPYKGIMQAVPDVVSGRIHLIITASNTALEGMVTKGDMKVIGSLGKNAIYQTSPVQSLSSISPDVYANGYYALVVAAGTPNNVVDKMQKDVNKIVATPEFRQFMTALGSPIDSTNATDFDRWIDYEVDRLKRIIKQTNIKID